MTKFVFVAEAPVAFGICIEADSIEEAVAKAKDTTEVRIQREGEPATPGAWCTTRLAIEEECFPGDGELTDCHEGARAVGFSKLTAMWERRETR